MAVEGLTKSFEGRTGITYALKDVSLSIRDNELFTLLGPSGCGKTTLLRILAGFEHATSGRVLLDGQSIEDVPPFRRPVNTMFQSYALFPHLSVGKNVAFGLEMLHWRAGEVRARTSEVLNLVRLGGLENRMPAELSGGQQQRVALARALAPRPRVLLLDEPLSALDLKLRRAMQMELKRLQRETAVSFVLVTHDQEEALALSDRIALMSAGQLQQLGSPQEMYENPCNCFVADFIGEANLLPGSLLGESSGTTIAVRPERLSLQRDGTTAERSLRGEVTAVTFLGSDTHIELSIGVKQSLRIRLRQLESPVAVGDRAVACWPREAERVLNQ